MTRHSSCTSRRLALPPCPKEILAAQRLVEVPYYGFDGRCHTGKIVVHEVIVPDVKVIFLALLKIEFPIAKMIPIGDPRYNWDDERSMQDNNTSGFNYRLVEGTDRLSWHSFGLAIDINPLYNPWIRKGKVSPQKGRYNPAVPGTIVDGSPIVELFLERGFVWGGHKEDYKDYHHFEKPIPSLQIPPGLV